MIWLLNLENSSFLCVKYTKILLTMETQVCYKINEIIA